MLKKVFVLSFLMFLGASAITPPVGFHITPPVGLKDTPPVGSQVDMLPPTIQDDFPQLD